MLVFREVYNTTWLIERHGFQTPASGRMLRSTTLESISIRPSARNRHKPVHRESA